MRRLAIPTVQGNWDEALGMGREVTGAIWPSPDAERRLHLLALDRCTPDRGELLLAATAAGHPAPGSRRPHGALCHGTPLKQNEYLWEDRPSRYFARIASDEGDDIAFGHTHQTFHRVTAAAHFIGVGSVGCGAGMQGALRGPASPTATWWWASAASSTTGLGGSGHGRRRPAAEPAARAAGAASAGGSGHDQHSARRGTRAGLIQLRPNLCIRPPSTLFHAAVRPRLAPRRGRPRRPAR